MRTFPNPNEPVYKLELVIGKVNTRDPTYYHLREATAKEIESYNAGSLKSVILK